MEWAGLVAIGIVGLLGHIAHDIRAIRKMIEWRNEQWLKKERPELYD